MNMNCILYIYCTQKEFMNTPFKQTGFSHQKSNGDLPIRQSQSNLEQKDQFCIVQQGKVCQKRKKWMENSIGLDSDQYSLDSQSLLIFQCDPLLGHKMVLQNLISKNHILLDKYSQFINQQFSNSKQSINPIFKTLRMQQYLELMLAKFRKFKPAMVNKFNNFLETERNFYKFLLYVYHSFSDIIVAKAMKLIFFIWELYVPYHKMKLQLKNVQILSGLISNKICENEFKFAKKQIISDHHQRQSYRQMIDILALTILLVIQQCSENPYFDDNDSMSEDTRKDQIRKDLKAEQCLDVCRKKTKGQSPIYFS